MLVLNLPPELILTVIGHVGNILNGQTNELEAKQR